VSRKGAPGHPSHTWIGDECTACRALKGTRYADNRCPKAAIGVEGPADLTGWPLWLVGLWLGTTGGGAAIWQYLGLEQSEAIADARCTSAEHFFVPVTVGRSYVDESLWPLAVYPRASSTGHGAAPDA
jgi:hypothetical protein